MIGLTQRMAPAALWCACIALCLATPGAAAAFYDDESADEADGVEPTDLGDADGPSDTGGSDAADLPGLDDAPAPPEQRPMDQWPLIIAYRASGLRSAQCEDDALGLVRDGELAMGSAPGEAVWVELADRAKALIESGCGTWPVHYVRVVALRRLEFPSGSESALREAMASLQREAATPFHLAYVAESLARVLEKWRKPEEARAFHELTAHYLLQVLHARCAGVSPHVIVSNLRVAVNDLPLDLADSFSARAQDHECVPLWLRKTLRGEYHIRAAWEARGTGWAHTVTRQGWRGFAHHLERASEHLREAYRLDPLQPYAATRMIAVVMAGHGDEGETLRLWYDRALVARPDWKSAHSQMLWALRPRWGGSLEEMYEFGMRFVEAPPNSNLPEIYLDMIVSIGSDKEGDFEFLAEKGAHATAAAVIEQLLMRPRSRDIVHRYRTIETVLAWAAGKWEAAARALDQMGGSLHPGICDQVWLWPEDVADEIRLFSSSVGPTALEAREAMAGRDFDRAADLNRVALAALNPEELHAERIARLLREQVTLAEQAKQYAAGEWVNLRFGPDMDGWRVRYGHWHSASAASVKGGRPQRYGHGTRAVSLLPVGPRFEAKADIRLQSSTANGGFIFHIGDNPNGRWIVGATSRDGVRLRYYFDEDDEVRGGARIHRPDRTLHLMVWEDRAVVRVNDQVVFRGAMPIGELSERFGPYFGLGCLWSARGSLAMYENVQVRRLKAMPEDFFKAASN